MPRAVPTELANLLANPRVESFSTLVLRYSDSGATTRYLATREFEDSLDSDRAYTGSLKGVSDLRFSLSETVDRVTATVYNNDRVIGADVASTLRYLTNATADIGRYYRADDTSDKYHACLFNGAIAKAEATNREVRFEIIDSFVSAGQVIAVRPLTENCAFTYKEPLTCGAVHASGTCDHRLNSVGGCANRGTGQTAKFGGWVFPYAPVVGVPSNGDGGSTGGGGGGGVGGSCFTAGTLVTMASGKEKPIEEVKAGEEVLCFYYDANLKTDVLARRKVLKTFEHEADSFYEFGFEHGRLEVTPEHPLYVKAGAFLTADFVKPGQRLNALKKNYRKADLPFKDNLLLSMAWNREAFLRGGTVKVYNIHVEEFETYFANRIPVHNRKDNTTVY